MNQFGEEVMLEVVLKVREALVKTVGKEIGDTKLLIGLVLQYDLIVEVLYPLPEHKSMVERSQIKTSLNVLQIFG